MWPCLKAMCHRARKCLQTVENGEGTRWFVIKAGNTLIAALALIYTRRDPAKVLGMFKTLAGWQRAAIKRQEDGVERYEDGMNTL